MIYRIFKNMTGCLMAAMLMVGGWFHGQDISENRTQSDLRQNADYLVSISAAYNSLEKQDFVRAGEQIGNYLSLRENYADAFLIMGEIFLRQKIYQQAEDYFAQAEKNKEYFINPETLVRLYWDQLLALSRSEGIEQIDPYSRAIVFDVFPEFAATDKKIHQVILKLIDFTSQHRGKFYRKNLGRAYFMLGRYLLRTNPLAGMEAFQKSARDPSFEKFVNLYLAYFFAIQDQEVINRVYQSGEKNLLPPEKKSAFLFYYQNYRNLPESEHASLRKSLIPDTEYEVMTFALEKYFKSLQ